MQGVDPAGAEAVEEAARSRDEARADATRIRDELQEQADQDVERIKQRGREQLAAQRDAYARSLQAETGSLSLRLAHRLIADAFADDEEKRASVDGFLDDLDGFGESGAVGARRAQQPAQTGGGVS